MSDLTDDELQQEMHEVLLDSIGPTGLLPDRGDAMKRRLLKRVAASVGASAADAHGLLTIRASEGDWQTLMPKVSMKVLLREGDTLSYLLRLEPGAKIPPHDHPQTEECVVLDGEAHIGELVVRPGDYHVAPAGRPHGLLGSDTGAVLFLRGAIPAARHLRWGSLDTYAALVPDALRNLASPRPAPK